jgi:hypothetical protein
MELLKTPVVAAYLVINILAVGLSIGSYRWPTLTRFLFFLIFSIAAYSNARTVLNTPWVYQDYAAYAIPLYKRFILGFFSGITTPMILCITVGQAFIAVSMFLKRDGFRIGCLGGIVFCLAIAPLGLGSAFPATVLLAIALYRLYRHEDRETIFEKIDHVDIPIPLD